MKQVVIINGTGGVGKGTFVNLCSQYISTLNISSVDIVKEAAKVLWWNGTKDEKSRKFLSDLKYLSSNYNDQPYTYIKNTISNFRLDETPYNLLFIDIREPEEIDRVKKDFGCKTLLIENVNVKDITTNEADANVKNYKYDYVIQNNYDINTLGQLAHDFVEKLRLENDR